MAAEYKRYGTNGAAAYDVYSNTYRYHDNTALQPERQWQHLPEEMPLPRKQQRVKAKTAVAPFTLFGMVAAACLLVLVIFGYVQLFEASTQVGELQSQLRQLQYEHTQLENRYNGKVNLEQIELRAAELGLAAPEENQVVYISLENEDRAEIFKQERTSVVGEIVGALEESVSNFIAYLRPTAA